MLEKEITYFNKKDLDFFEVFTTIIKEFKIQEELRIKYNDWVEIRYTDNEVDKARVTFKVNHGEILWRQSYKERISNRFERIQLYKEKKTDWKPLIYLNTEIFRDHNIEALYYKERFK